MENKYKYYIVIPKAATKLFNGFQQCSNPFPKKEQALSSKISLNSSPDLIFYCNSKELYGKY